MINNNNLLTKRITNSHVLWYNSFNIDEINNIINDCEKENLSEAHVLINDRVVTQDNNIRRSKIKFFNKNNKNFWIFNRFNNVIDSINHKFYNLDLYGYDYFQYTMYDFSDNGMYDWHQDTVLNNIPDNMLYDSTRKLSLIMLLSQPHKEFTGGEFQLNLGMEKNALTPTLNKGDIIAFPSFLIHRVKPVLTGVRKSIVIWVEGPKFR